MFGLASVAGRNILGMPFILFYVRIVKTSASDSSASEDKDAMTKMIELGCPSGRSSESAGRNLGMPFILFYVRTALRPPFRRSRLTRLREAVRRPLKAVYALLKGNREGSCFRFCGCADNRVRHRPNPDTPVYFPTCANTGRPVDECDCLEGEEL